MGIAVRERRRRQTHGLKQFMAAMHPLLARLAFGLEHDEALLRIGTIVHALDVGGERVAEAVGLEAVLAGARERCAADDDLLQRFSAVLDDMYLAFSKQQRDATVTE